MLRRLRVAPITSFALTDSLSVVTCPSPHYARFCSGLQGEGKASHSQFLGNVGRQQHVSTQKLFISTTLPVYCIFIINDIMYKREMRNGRLRNDVWGIYLLHDVSIECHHCHVSNAHERLKAFSIITRPRYSLYPTGHIGLSSHIHIHTPGPNTSLVITSLSISSWVPLGLSPRV